ncbi:MAG TPA: hypothetical protein VHN74_06605 [Candidatus Angelobacter sp.]|jgi:hypothetical protein|nr:hypothetical protein [Candidatus Angelobacter sp.]
MNTVRFFSRRQFAMMALALMSAFCVRSFAQDAHSHVAAAQKADPGTLMQVVRDATAKFQDVDAAVHAGYVLTFGCVTGPDAGAMGLHYVNFTLFNSGVLDPQQPTIIIYEPTPGGGKPRLIGADFLVLKDQWDSQHNAPPALMGQLFHLFDAPNRFGLPSFYTLHVWAWKDNPSGPFVNWHPNVSCQSFTAP